MFLCLSTISRDPSSIREEAKTHVRKYIDERLPEEYEKCLVGLTAILREAWNTYQETEDNREKIQALFLRYITDLRYRFESIRVVFLCASLVLFSTI